MYQREMVHAFVFCLWETDALNRAGLHMKQEVVMSSRCSSNCCNTREMGRGGRGLCLRREKKTG